MSARHGWLGMLLGLVLGLGVGLLLVSTSVLALSSLWPLVGVVAGGAVLGALWGAFGPAKPPKPTAGERS
ncbi:MAG: hypothetical protein MUC45_07395 [Actinomycetia bacterium]|jgi:hypothetical protein|nr:hypothetical protein [Actinomycetes bacterium]